MKRTILATSAVLSLSVGGAAIAQDVKSHNFKVVGIWGNLSS